MAKLKLSEAQALFDELAADPGLKHEFNAFYCQIRREMMILNMLDRNVPMEDIGRITCLAAKDTEISIPNMHSLLEDRKYEHSPHRVAKNGWKMHTAPTLEVFDEGMGETVRMVLDPSLNPLRMMTVPDWEHALSSRILPYIGSGGAQLATDTAPSFVEWGIGETPVVTADKHPAVSKDTFMNDFNARARVTDTSRITFIEEGSFIRKGTDWDALPNREPSRDYLQHMLSRTGYSTPRDTNLQERYARFENWSKTPCI